MFPAFISQINMRQKGSYYKLYENQRALEEYASEVTA